MKVAVLLAITCQMVMAQQYTNVVYIGVQSATGSYGATSYVNVCKTPPSLVLTNFPLCKDGTPLAGLRVGTNVTDFSGRIGTGSIVGPTGKLIAQTFSQFLSEPLNQSLSQAGVTCSTFFSNANPSTGLVPNGMNDGCALGFGNSLGSNSALRSYFQGNCTSTAAMTWYSGTAMPACSVSTSLLCFCTSLNAPTSSPTLPTALPSKSPTASPSRTPSRSPVHSPSRSPTPSTAQPTPLPTSQKPSLTPTRSPTFRPTFSKPTITNVVYTATSSADGSIGASNFVANCANIPANVLLNFPGCSNGVPLASLRIAGTTSHFLYRIDSGQIVGPNGFVIADNATQFFTKPLRMTLSAAEVGCSTFFSGSLSTGLGNTGTNECATSTSGDFLSSKDEDYSYRRGSCTSSAIGWFNTASAKCESKTSFLCVCRVLVTDSPVPAPSTAPAPPTPPTATPSISPITKSPTIAPTNPTGAPTKLPTTLAPTKRPSTQAPTYGPAEYSVIYVGTTNVKGNYGASNYASMCRNVPDAVYQQFPDCTGGAPFASLRIGGVTTHLTSRIKAGAVYGPNGALIAASPSELYNGPLTASLASAGVSCTTFFSGSLSSGLANTGTTECSTSSTGDFLADDDEDYSYHVGSCTSSSATWFSTSTGKCDKATTFLCYCQVYTIEQSQSSSPTVSSALGSSSNQGTSEAVTIVAWGLVGILAAMVAVAGGVFYVRRMQKSRMGTPGAHIQMTTASIRNSERLIPPATALSARMPGDIEETKMNN